MQRLNTILVTCSLCLAAVLPLGAHPRDYLVTYPYWTVPKGRVELEIKTDFVRPDFGDSSPDKLVQQTEIEYGITDRLMMAVYAVFEKPNGSSANYEETKLQLRYRLAQPGRYYFNPALYTEYIKAAGDGEDEIEAKLILQKDLPRGVNVAINGILEHEVGSGEWEKGFAVGISKPVWPKAKLGLELKGGEGKLFVIPGAYIDIARGKRLNIGPMFGLTSKSEDFQLKTLLEYEF